MSTTRRTLSDTLTRAQRAFLTVANEPREIPLEDACESSDLPSESEHVRPDDAHASRRITRNNRIDHSTRRPEPLRSVTLRFRASVADALRRESIKRSLDYVEPFSQQAIVEAALCSWLHGQGYRLDD